MEPVTSDSPPSLLSLENGQLLIRRADVSELLDLRWRSLRLGLPRDEAHFDGDAEPTTHHFGAFAERYGTPPAAVCCATFVLNSWQGEPAWQLRGMATDDGYRGRGVGQAVLAYAEACVTRPAAGREPPRLLWCNARVPALGFYQRQGWQVASDEFDIPTAGPHRKMCKLPRMNTDEHG